LNSGPSSGHENRPKKYISMAEERLSEALSRGSNPVIEEAARYIEDAKFYLEKGDEETSLAAASYSYGLLDGMLGGNRYITSDMRKSMLKIVYLRGIGKDEDLSKLLDDRGMNEDLYHLIVNGMVEEGLVEARDKRVLSAKGRKLLRVGLVAGVFDLIHPGHVAFLRWCKEQVDVLVAVVARDPASRIRKGREPVQSETDRLGIIREFRMVDLALLGDRDDIYRPVARVQPDVILLGKDQAVAEESIREDLKRRGLEAEVERTQIWDTGELSKTTRIIERIRRRSRN